MSGTSVAVFRNFGIPCLDIFVDSLLTSGTGNIFSGVSWQVGVGTFIRCFRFLRNTRPPLSKMYNLRLWSLLMTLDSVVHCFSFQLDSYPIPWLEWRELSCAIPSVKRLLIAPFALTSAFLTAAWSVSFRYETLTIFGMVVRICLPLISSAGVFLVAGTGVARSAIRVRNGSSCSRIRLEIRTPLSAEPFAWWWCGLDVVCLNPYSALNSSNIADLNCVPLSLTSSSGIPHRANTNFSFWITAWLVVSIRFNILMNLE